MLKRTSHHLGLATGLLALFVALGGPAWAVDRINGADIEKGTVTGKQVKNSSLTGTDLRNGSVRRGDLATGSVGSATIANGAITTPDFAASAVAPQARRLPGLRTEAGTSPNIVGGADGNSVTSGATGATIGGGGFTGFVNLVTDAFGTIGGGRGNTVGNEGGTTDDAIAGTVGGGENNAATGAYGTVPGGLSNSAGAFSFAAGRRAQAGNVGSFVWADSTNANFSSTADNQFAIRAANGMIIANDAGGAKVVPVGTRYRDNAIVAWARVTAAGGLDTNFNVASVVRVSTGIYRFTLNSSLSSGFSLVPLVTPELDPVVVDPPTAPTGAANVRIPATNQVAAGNTFDVYMYNGNFALVDNDFQVLVTGR